MDLDQCSEWLHDGIAWDWLLAFRAWCKADYCNWEKIERILDEIDHIYLLRSK